MKKMKKHLLKRQHLLPCCQTSSATTNDDGTKRKIKCTEELCKHRRHKKKRKHKKHDLERGEEGAEQQKSEVVGASEPVEDTTKHYHVVVEKQQQAEKEQFSAVDNEDTEETMDSYSAADDPDFRDPVSGNNPMNRLSEYLIGF